MLNIKYAFFGSSQFSIYVLDELEKAGFIPAVVVTTPDKPKGRKLVMTPTAVKEWANKRNLPVIDAGKLDDDFATQLKAYNCDVFVVASYGKIIPQRVLDIAPKQTLNVHPSLLPKYRGASPLQSAILDDDKNTGVTIMRINEKMDEGPIVIQKETPVSEWPPYEIFEEDMGRVGGKLLAEVLPDWIAGKIKEQEQNHAGATYTRKIVKEDGLIDTSDSARVYENFRKIQAYHQWPQAYFFHEKDGQKIRVKITDALYKDGQLKIEKVIPENDKEMTYESFVTKYK